MGALTLLIMAEQTINYCIYITINLIPALGAQGQVSEGYQICLLGEQ